MGTHPSPTPRVGSKFWTRPCQLRFISHCWHMWLEPPLSAKVTTLVCPFAKFPSHHVCLVHSRVADAVRLVSLMTMNFAYDFSWRRSSFKGNNIAALVTARKARHFILSKSVSKTLTTRTKCAKAQLRLIARTVFGSSRIREPAHKSWLTPTFTIPILQFVVGGSAPNNVIFCPTYAVIFLFVFCSISYFNTLITLL